MDSPYCCTVQEHETLAPRQMRLTRPATPKPMQDIIRALKSVMPMRVSERNSQSCAILCDLVGVTECSRSPTAFQMELDLPRRDGSAEDSPG